MKHKANHINDVIKLCAVNKKSIINRKDMIMFLKTIVFWLNTVSNLKVLAKIIKKQFVKQKNNLVFQKVP